MLVSGIQILTIYRNRAYLTPKLEALNWNFEHTYSAVSWPKCKKVDEWDVPFPHEAIMKILLKLMESGSGIP